MQRISFDYFNVSAITEEFFKSANQSNSCIMQNLENSLTKQPIVSLLKQRLLKESIPRKHMLAASITERFA